MHHDSRAQAVRIRRQAKVAGCVGWIRAKMGSAGIAPSTRRYLKHWAKHFATADGKDGKDGKDGNDVGFLLDSSEFRMI